MSSIDRGVYAPPLRDFARIDPHFSRIDSRADEPRRGPMLLMLSIAVLLAIVGVIWSTYNQGVRGRDDPPVIAALGQPYKIAPAEPGGERTEHLGVEVFNVLENAAPAAPAESELALVDPLEMTEPHVPGVEAIEDWEVVEPHDVNAASAELEPLEAVEEHADEEVVDPGLVSVEVHIPIPRLKPLQRDPADIAADSTGPRTLETAAEPASAPPPASGYTDPTRPYLAYRTPVVTTPGPDAAADPVDQGATEGAAAAAPAPADAVPPVVPVREEPAPPAAPPVVVPGSFLVQLASFRSEDAADDAWRDFRSEFRDLIGGYEPNVERADLGDRGVRFRLRIGVFADRTAATSFCDVVKARGRECLVVGL